MYAKQVVLLIALFLSGCAATSSTPSAPVTAVIESRGAELSPIQAILGAAERPEGITGTFRVEIRGAGRQNGWLYLNSEVDYRDQQNLTIALPPKAAQDLEAKIGADPVIAMKGKVVRVNGTAQRTTIWFIENGQRSDKYYYQTHVRLTDLSQIRVLE